MDIQNYIGGNSLNDVWYKKIEWIFCLKIQQHVLRNEVSYQQAPYLNLTERCQAHSATYK